MGQKRYTVRDAATHLSISESAVRNRLSRGTITGVKEGGVTYVVLEDVTTDTDDIPPTDAATDHRDELIEELRDRVRSLERANEENRRIIMQQAQNLAAIEAPENGERSPDVEEPPADTEGSESCAPARKSWWRRLFGR